MNAGKRCIVGGHAIELQAGYGVHAFFGHIFLGEDGGDFFSTVVTVVEENHSIAVFDGSVYIGVDNGFDEFVGHICVIRCLHGSNEVGCFFALTVDKKVVGNFDTFPTFVAVHSVVATDD